MYLIYRQCMSDDFNSLDILTCRHSLCTSNTSFPPELHGRVRVQTIQIDCEKLHRSRRGKQLCHHNLPCPHKDGGISHNQGWRNRWHFPWFCAVLCENMTISSCLDIYIVTVIFSMFECFTHIYPSIIEWAYPLSFWTYSSSFRT